VWWVWWVWDNQNGEFWWRKHQLVASSHPLCYPFIELHLGTYPSGDKYDIGICFHHSNHLGVYPSNFKYRNIHCLQHALRLWWWSPAEDMCFPKE
jgi:hypothetical protein